MSPLADRISIPQVESAKSAERILTDSGWFPVEDVPRICSIGLLTEVDSQSILGNVLGWLSLLGAE